MDLTMLLPESINAWEGGHEDGLYDRETIFRYMNGSGEVYLSFDFRSLLVRRYHDATGRAITVELYDMARSAEAFGIFSRNRSGEDAGVGQGSEYHTNHLFFWRDRYFVTVFSEQEFENANEAIIALGRDIAARIGKDGPEPSMVGRFPVEGLDSRSIRYFHKHTDLNQHYFLSDENILDLDANAEAALAIYERDGAILYLLLIDFANEDVGSVAYGKYIDAYTPNTNAGEAVRVEDGTWTVSIRSGRHVIAVFDATGAEGATNLLSEAFARLEGDER